MPRGRASKPPSGEATATADLSTSTNTSGLTLSGSLRLEVIGQDWRLQKQAPLNCSLIPMPDHLLAIPSDASGGLRGGDQTQIEVIVRANASLVWQAPGASLVFPVSAGTPAHQPSSLNTRILVEPGGRLVFLARPVIPCRGSRLRQSTSIELAPGAQLFYREIMMAGRVAAGESFAFDCLKNSLELWRDGSLLYKEAWHFQPAAGLPLGPAGFGGQLAWGTAIGCGLPEIMQGEKRDWQSQGFEFCVDSLDSETSLGRFGSRQPNDQVYSRFSI